MKIVKILLVVIVILALLVGGFMIYQRIQNDRARAELEAQVAQTVNACTDQITALRGELDQLTAKEAEYQPNMLAGFVPAGREDLPRALRMTNGYNFQSVILLDCSLGEEAVTGILQDADSSQCDVLLMGTEEDLDTAVAVQSQMTKFGFKPNRAFLLTGAEDTAAAEKAILGRGFDAVVMPVDGAMKWEKVLEFSDLNTAMARISDDKSTLVLCFDLARVDRGTLSESAINMWLDAIQSGLTARTLHSPSVADAVAGIGAEVLTRSDYEAQAKVLTDKIDELQALIEINQAKLEETNR